MVSLTGTELLQTAQKKLGHGKTDPYVWVTKKKHYVACRVKLWEQKKSLNRKPEAHAKVL
jgi:hypothetical protein